MQLRIHSLFYFRYSKILYYVRRPNHCLSFQQYCINIVFPRFSQAFYSVSFHLDSKFQKDSKLFSKFQKVEKCLDGGIVLRRPDPIPARRAIRWKTRGKERKKRKVRAKLNSDSNPLFAAQEKNLPLLLSQISKASERYSNLI